MYAIENGGFSGAIMPQNVVVGQDAMKVAQFVATYAGRQSPKVPGVPTCTSQPVGALPAAGTPTSTTPTATTASKPAATTKTKAKPAATTKTTAKPAPKKK